jgi:hypothetical protein
MYCRSLPVKLSDKFLFRKYSVKKTTTVKQLRFTS